MNIKDISVESMSPSGFKFPFLGIGVEGYRFYNEVVIKNKTNKIVPEAPSFFALDARAYHVFNSKKKIKGMIENVSPYTNWNQSMTPQYINEFKTLGVAFRLRPKEKRKFIVRFRLPSGVYSIQPTLFILKSKSEIDVLKGVEFSKDRMGCPMILKHKSKIGKEVSLFSKECKLFLSNPKEKNLVSFLDLQGFGLAPIRESGVTILTRPEAITIGVSFLAILLSIINILTQIIGFS